MVRKTNIPCDSCGFDPLRTITYDVTILVPMVWKSRNHIGNPTGKRAWMYHAYKREFKEKGGVHFMGVKEAKGKRRVEFVRLMGKWAKPIDPDNLDSGRKPLTDVLVDVGLLIDDSPKYVEHAPVRQEKHDRHYIQIRLIDYAEEKQQE